MRKVKLTADTKQNLLNDLLKRSPNNYTEYENVVADIINNVRAKGDAAVFEYTKKFDKWEVSADNLKVTEAEIEEAFQSIEPAFVEVMHKSANNIAVFHQKQLHNSWMAVFWDRRFFLSLFPVSMCRAGKQLTQAVSL